MREKDYTTLKVSSKKVRTWIKETAEIAIPELESERDEAKLELLLVVKHNEGYSDAKLDEIREVDGFYVYRMSRKMYGHNLNTETDENVLDVNKFLGSIKLINDLI